MFRYHTLDIRIIIKTLLFALLCIVFPYTLIIEKTTYRILRVPLYIVYCTIKCQVQNVKVKNVKVHSCLSIIILYNVICVVNSYITIKHCRIL